VIGGYVYRGSRVPALRGRYVYGDICGAIYSLKLVKGRVSGEPKYLDRVNALSSFGEDGNGELYALGLTNGTLYTLR
jgi:hypothetical protein